MTPTRVLRSLVAPVLSLALVLGPHAAAAQDTTWAQTFDTPAVAAHVAARGGDVLIITAGKRSAALQEVAKAFRDELEEAGTAGVVTMSEASKEKAALDDASLVGALEDDVDRVVIVRVDEGRATISVYDAGGTAMGGFSAARGDQIEEPPESSHAGDSPLAVVEGEVPELEGDALREYERKRVVFNGAVKVTATGANSAVVSRGFEPQTGAGAPLPDDEFYRYIGRDDLVKEYRRRKIARTALISTGSVAAVTGVVLMMALPLAAVIQDDGSDCLDLDDSMATDACEAAADARRRSRIRTGLGAGGGLLAGGLVMTIVGGKIRPHKATAAEVQEMGERYNEDLRRRLGVRDVAVRGSANRHGGGVVLSGRF